MAFSGDKWRGYRWRTREDRATQFVNIGDWVLQWIRFINWLPKYLSVFSERYTVLLSGSLLKATLLYWRRQPWWIWPWWWSSGEERHCLQSWYPMKRSILKQYSFESFWNVTCTHQWWQWLLMRNVLDMIKVSNYWTGTLSTICNNNNNILSCWMVTQIYNITSLSILGCQKAL